MVAKVAPGDGQGAVDARLPTVDVGAGGDQLWAMIYGESGVGKTMFCGSAALDRRMAPLLLVDSEGGTRSLRHIRDVATKRPIQVWPIVDYAEDMPQLRSYLRSALAEGNLPYRTLAIDSLTVLGKRLMDSIQIRNRHNPANEQPTWDEWSSFLLKMLDLLKEFQRLSQEHGLNVIITALEDDETGTHRPKTQGKKLPPELPGQFDTVGRLYVKGMTTTEGASDVEYRLMLRADSRYTTKDRSAPAGVQPNEIVAPTAGKLLDRVVEGNQLAEQAAHTPTAAERVEPNGTGKEKAVR